MDRSTDRQTDRQTDRPATTSRAARRAAERASKKPAKRPADASGHACEHDTNGGYDFAKGGKQEITGCHCNCWLRRGYVKAGDFIERWGTSNAAVTYFGFKCQHTSHAQFFLSHEELCGLGMGCPHKECLVEKPPEPVGHVAAPLHAMTRTIKKAVEYIIDVRLN